MSNPNTTSLEMVRQQKAKLHSSVHALEEELAKLRSRISEKHQRIQAIENAEVPSAVAVERFIEYVDKMASRAGFEVAARGFYQPRNYTPERLFHAQVSEETDNADINSAICYLFRDRLIDCFKAIGPRNSENVMPLRGRGQLISQIRQELKALEELEEEMIVEFTRMGFPVERREGVDPAIVLDWQD